LPSTTRRSSERSWRSAPLWPGRTNPNIQPRLLTVKITARRKKKVKLLREVSLDLSQGPRRAETETGLGTVIGGDPSPGPGPGPESGRRRVRKRRETDLVTGLGRDTVGTDPESETDISETGEMIETDVTETRTTLMN